MKALIAVLAVVFAVGATVPAATAAYGYPGFQFDVQGDKRRGGGGGGQERGQPPRDFQQPRDFRPDRGERRERLNDDERRALHRDLDKANRELYQRRHP